MSPLLNKKPKVKSAPPPKVPFDRLTWILMKNSSLPDYKFRAKLLELARDANISQKDWCQDILRKIDSKKIYKIIPTTVSAEEFSKFVGICERQLRPLYPTGKLPDRSTKQHEKLRIGSLLDSLTPLPKNSKQLSDKTNDLDSSVKVSNLSETDYVYSEFNDDARDAMLMNRKVLIAARPNVEVTSKNFKGVSLHGTGILSKVGDIAGFDTMGKTVCVAGFESDGRPFFETLPELLVRSEDGNQVFRIGYDANGKPIHALFDMHKNFEGIFEKGYIWSNPTERFECYVNFYFGDIDDSLPVDDMDDSLLVDDMDKSMGVIASEEEVA